MTSLSKRNRTEETNVKRLILLLRWMIFIVMMFLFLYSRGKEVTTNIGFFKWFLLFYVVSNVGLGFINYRKFLLNAVKSSIFLFDTIFISILIYLASGADVELYLAYFFVIFMAAMGQSIVLSLFITFFISILYIAILLQTMPIENIYNTSILIRIPFLFGVAVFSSYFAQEAKKYKEYSKRVEGLYEEVKAQLFQSSKLASVGTLSSSIIHEISNLLQIIMGSAESIKRHQEKTENNKKRINDICEISEQGGRIAKGLLAFSHQGSTGFEKTDVKQVLNESFELAKYNFEKGNIQIVKDYNEEPCIILGNMNQLKQVAINFMNNARDAMKDGGKLTVVCRAEAENIIVEFIDEGRGIPDKLKDRIFAPFFTTKEEGKGTGLGLSISRDIINLHNGSLDCKSREGEGTTFRMVFPCG